MFGHFLYNAEGHKMHIIMHSLLLFSLLLAAINLSCSSPLQIINSFGQLNSDFTIGKFVKSKVANKETSLKTISILDCTGAGDCKFVNSLLGTSFRGVNGVLLDVVKDTAIIYAIFNTTYANTFCGTKATDLQCSLSSFEIQPCLCIAMVASDLDLALQSYDQVFRRMLSFKHDLSAGDDGLDRGLAVTMLLDESAAEESNIAEYANKIELFLKQVWSEQYDKEEFPADLRVEVVLVPRDNPVLLEQARNNLADILNKQYQATLLPSAEDVASSGVDSEERPVGVRADRLAGALSKAWKNVPNNAPPVLSLAQREALFAIESAYTSGRNQADLAIRQWQVRVAKGRTVGKFSLRVSQLLSALRRDFYQRTASPTATSLVRERGERLLSLRQHVLGITGRLFLQQLVVLEFFTVASFKRELAKLVAREDLDDAERKDQEQVQLRKAVFEYRAQASDLEDASLSFLLSDERVSELTATLEAVLQDFPESPTAKLEEVRKLERLAYKGKLAQPPRTGKGRKRKGIAKALGVTLGLVGMLRPPGFGNLQGYASYATALLGLPLELLLGVHNDGETAEIQGEDREYPLLRLQPKLKFDIDL